MPPYAWTQEDVAFLREHYPDKGKVWCCNAMNRTEASIRQQAYELGLRQNPKGQFFREWQSRAAASKVGKKRPGHSAFMRQRIHANPALRMKMTAAMHGGAAKAMQNPEYKAKVLARLASPENLAKAGAAQQRPELRAIHRANGKRRWAENDAFRAKTMKRLQGQEHRKEHSRFMTERLKAQTSAYSRTQSGKRNINGREQFFRSRWEANIARVLDFQGRRWQYEAMTFPFDKVRRGTRSYTPDFYLPDEDLYIEVKGWWDAKSLTKKKRMAKYHPGIKIEYWDSKMYRVLERQLSSIIKDWE